MKLFNGRPATRCKQYSEIRIAICWTKGCPAASGLGRCAFIARHPGNQLTIDHERTASFSSSLTVLSSASRWCVAAIVYQVCGTFSINPSSFDDRAVAKRPIIRHTGAISRYEFAVPAIRVFRWLSIVLRPVYASLQITLTLLRERKRRLHVWERDFIAEFVDSTWIEIYFEFSKQVFSVE